MHFYAILALAASCGAVLVERLEVLPKEWSLAHYAFPDEPIKLEIALKEQNVEYFQQLVLDISTPGHAQYGNFLEREEVEVIIRPHEDSFEAVHSWLESNHVYSFITDGDMVEFHTNVSNAERMLSTKFAWYSHDTHKTQPWQLRTTEYSLPQHLTSHVDFINPTIKFPTTHAMRSTISPNPSGAKESMQKMLQWQAAQSKSVDAIVPPNAVCSEVITPQCLLNLYNVHYGAPANGTKVAFASFLTQYARYTDLFLFETTQAMYAEGQNFSVIEFNGGLNDQSSTGDATEANLDCQYITSVAYPVHVLEYSTAGCGPIQPDQSEAKGSCSNEPYVAFLKGILNQKTKALPQTLSISYGEDEQSWPQPIATKVCNQFSQLAARGVSVMFASGDFGPGGGNDICENNAGTKARFVPGFPASCPWVTAVGATQNIPEQAASFSGGGFSNYFAQPSYQKSAVTSYLSKHTAFAQYYNKSGRGYPDVSAQGVDFLVVEMGLTEPVSGTSASSPTFASIIALLNAARVSSGKAALGFLNPLLYAAGGVASFNDITTGGSTSCTGGNLTIPGAGFNATTGWDPVTGLGTPDFGKLLAYLAPGVANTGGVISA